MEEDLELAMKFWKDLGTHFNNYAESDEQKFSSEKLENYSTCLLEIIKNYEDCYAVIKDKK